MSNNAQLYIISEFNKNEERKKLLGEVSSYKGITKNKKAKIPLYREHNSLPPHGDPSCKNVVSAIISSSITPDERGSTISFSSSFGSNSSIGSNYSFGSCNSCSFSDTGHFRSGGVITPP